MVKIAVVNQSSLVSDDEIAAIVPALQRQVSEHFSPIWGIDAGISAVQQNGGDWLCFILDDADQANALGYHDMTAAGQKRGSLRPTSSRPAPFLASRNSSREPSASGTRSPADSSSRSFR